MQGLRSSWKHRKIGRAEAATRVYDRDEFLAEKRRALDAWAQRLLEIVGDVERPDSLVALNG